VATSASGAAVVGSGTHFINLASPITTRDNLRQGAADILVLAKSLANLMLMVLQVAMLICHKCVFLAFL
jgi:hypothetical protein